MELDQLQERFNQLISYIETVLTTYEFTFLLTLDSRAIRIASAARDLTWNVVGGHKSRLYAPLFYLQFFTMTLWKTVGQLLLYTRHCCIQLSCLPRTCVFCVEIENPNNYCNDEKDELVNLLMHQKVDQSILSDVLEFASTVVPAITEDISRVLITLKFLTME